MAWRGAADRRRRRVPGRAGADVDVRRDGRRRGREPRARGAAGAAVRPAAVPGRLRRVLGRQDHRDGAAARLHRPARLGAGRPARHQAEAQPRQRLALPAPARTDPCRPRRGAGGSPDARPTGRCRRARPGAHGRARTGHPAAGGRAAAGGGHLRPRCGRARRRRPAAVVDRGGGRVRRIRQAVLVLLLFAFWVGLSGRLDPLFLVLGALSSLAVALAATPLFEATLGGAGRHPWVKVWRLVPYGAWLLGRMVVSAFQIARIVLDPRIPPEPGIVRFRTQLSSPAARAMLANSITLVPGTMTLEVDGDEITMHSFTPDATDDLASAAMQDRIARIFGDPPQAPPELIWDSGHTGRGFTIVHAADDLELEPPTPRAPATGEHTDADRPADGTTRDDGEGTS
ncbi:hypothetical protein FTX61_02715 [Nitriliruptoraceae bacterium ZYF776]|nr:hypothetical protein [Profundirhabdus halotolerans]